MTGTGCDRLRVASEVQVNAPVANAENAVGVALAPICLEQSRQDPEVEVTLADLKETNSYQGFDMLM